VPVDIDLDLLTHASMMRELAPVTDGDVASAQDVADVFTGLGLFPGHVDLASRFDRRFSGALSRKLT
jgi:sulfonate transport system substrate-binding protein